MAWFGEVSTAPISAEQRLIVPDEELSTVDRVSVPAQQSGGGAGLDWSLPGASTPAASTSDSDSGSGGGVDENAPPGYDPLPLHDPEEQARAEAGLPPVPPEEESGLSPRAQPQGRAWPWLALALGFSSGLGIMWWRSR